jgi:hypothetical protein
MHLASLHSQVSKHLKEECFLLLKMMFRFGCRLSIIKTEYMRCQFSGKNSNDGNASLDGRVVSMNDTFRYLRSMLQSDGEIDKDVSHKIRVERVKLR